MKQKRHWSRNSIRALRCKRGLTQAQLAKLLDTPQHIVSAYENGQTAPSLRTFTRIAAVLGYPSLVAHFYTELDRRARKEAVKKRKELDIKLHYPI